MDRIVLICLGIWALLTGIALVTNLQIVWMGPLTGLAALILGVVCLIRAFAGARSP
jgi:uncharacterized membrane protein